MSDIRIPFKDAVVAFRGFLREQGWSDQILWLTRDRMTGHRTRYWLFRPEECNTQLSTLDFYNAILSTTNNRLVLTLHPRHASCVRTCRAAGSGQHSRDVPLARITGSSIPKHSNGNPHQANGMGNVCHDVISHPDGNRHHQKRRIIPERTEQDSLQPLSSCQHRLSHRAVDLASRCGKRQRSDFIAMKQIGQQGSEGTKPRGGVLPLTADVGSNR
jgi:hypothetical protein